MDPIDPWVDSAEVRRLAETLLLPVREGAPATNELCFGDEFIGFAGPKPAAPAVRPPTATMAPDPVDEPDPVILHHLQETARQSLAGARHRAQSGGLLERPSPPPPLRESAPTPCPQTFRQVAVPAISNEPPPPPPQAQPPQPKSESESVPPAPAPAPIGQTAPFVERLHTFGSWLRTAVQAKAFFVSDRDGHVLIDEVRSPKLLHVARTLAQASHAANRHAGGGTVGSLHVKLGEASILEVLPVETDYGPLILGIVVPSVLSGGAIPVISSGLRQVVDSHPT